MISRPTRRGWLAGMVAVFAGWASTVFGRNPKVAPTSTPTPALLVRCRPNAQVGPVWDSYQRLDGKVVIEPGPTDGEFLVTVYDREGNEIERTREKLCAVYIYPPHGQVEWKTYRSDRTNMGNAPCQRTTCVYDENGKLTATG